MGDWQLDPYHTQVEFSAKHLGMMTVRGHFAEVSSVADIHRACGYQDYYASVFERYAWQQADERFRRRLLTKAARMRTRATARNQPPGATDR